MATEESPKKKGINAPCSASRTPPSVVQFLAKTARAVLPKSDMSQSVGRVEGGVIEARGYRLFSQTALRRSTSSRWIVSFTISR